MPFWVIKSKVPPLAGTSTLLLSRITALAFPSEPTVRWVTRTVTVPTGDSPSYVPSAAVPDARTSLDPGTSKRTRTPASALPSGSVTRPLTDVRLIARGGDGDGTLGEATASLPTALMTRVVTDLNRTFFPVFPTVSYPVE